MSIPGFTEAFMAVYLITFSLILLLFECRLFGENMLRENFGFLFSYWGRFGFLCFIATLDFSITDSTVAAMAYISGIAMCINAAFNMYIICVHPEFNQKLSGSADP